MQKKLRPESQALVRAEVVKLWPQSDNPPNPKSDRIGPEINDRTNTISNRDKGLNCDRTLKSDRTEVRQNDRTSENDRTTLEKTDRTNIITGHDYSLKYDRTRLSQNDRTGPEIEINDKSDRTEVRQNDRTFESDRSVVRTSDRSLYQNDRTFENDRTIEEKSDRTEVDQSDRTINEMKRLRGNQAHVLYYCILREDTLVREPLRILDMQRDMWEMGITEKLIYERSLRRILKNLEMKRRWIVCTLSPRRNDGQTIRLDQKVRMVSNEYKAWFESDRSLTAKSDRTKMNQSDRISQSDRSSDRTSSYKERKKEIFLSSSSLPPPQNNEGCQQKSWHHPVLDLTETEYREKWSLLWNLGIFQSNLAQALKAHVEEFGETVDVQKFYQGLRNAEWELEHFDTLHAAGNQPADSPRGYLIRTLSREGFWRRHKDHLHSDQVYAKEIRVRQQAQAKILAQAEANRQAALDTEKEQKSAEYQTEALKWCDEHSEEERFELAVQSRLHGFQKKNPETVVRALKMGWPRVKEFWEKAKKEEANAATLTPCKVENAEKHDLIMQGISQGVK